MSIGFNGDTFKCRYPAVAGFPQPAFEFIRDYEEKSVNNNLL